MQELRLVAVSEDGTYAVLAAPGQGGRFALPIDDRLRIVARGQFSRLAQYEIEVERPLRPKEIQDRIRAGETAEEIAEAAGVPIDRVRRFEGPVLAERAHWAGQAQEAAIRQPGDSGPGRRLGDVVGERLGQLGADPDSAEWDSRKRSDGAWQVRLTFAVNGYQRLAEWHFDPRRRHVAPADDTAAGLSLPEGELPPAPRPAATATVTPIGSRLAAAESAPGARDGDGARHEHRFSAAAAADSVPGPRPEPAAPPAPAPRPAALEQAGSRTPRLAPGFPAQPAASPPLRGAAVPATHSPAAQAPAAHAPAAQSGRPGQSPAARGAAQAEADRGPALEQTEAPAASKAAIAERPGPAQSAPQQAAPETPTPDQAAPDAPAAAPPAAPARERPARRAAGGRSRRSSVPSWDEIMFGTSRQSDEA